MATTIKSDYTCYVLDEYLTFNWYHPEPPKPDDLLRKGSFILDKYDGSVNLKRLIFYHYGLLLSNAKIVAQGTHYIYEAKMTGPYALYDDFVLLDNHHHYRFCGSDSSLSPDLLVTYDFYISKTHRVGQDFSTTHVNPALKIFKDMERTPSFQQIMQDFYGVLLMSDQNNRIRMISPAVLKT